MHAVEPQIFIISESRMCSPGLVKMLKAIGANEWQPSSSTPPELLVEVAGRMCYKSFQPGLNPNVTKVREGNKEYIGNILKQKHGSVLEHANTTVALIGVSRILTHELVRHRAGCAYSQESMRYVRMEDVGMYVPDCIKDAGAMAKAMWDEAIQHAERQYMNLSRELIRDDMPFHEKKQITSALRRIAPGGHTTNIIITANHRAWRHLIDLRTAEGAEEEIVKAFMLVAMEFGECYPAFYQDMYRTPHKDNPQLYHYQFENGKI